MKRILISAAVDEQWRYMTVITERPHISDMGSTFFITSGLSLYYIFKIIMKNHVKKMGGVLGLEPLPFTPEFGVRFPVSAV